MKKRKTLIINQLDKKLEQLSTLTNVSRPSGGWTKAIRTALNMSLRQLSNKLGTNIASTNEIEQREAEGSITIKKMNEVAKALDMKFVYALIPNEGTLEKMIEKKARQLAIEIVLRTSQNMKLEDQQNTDTRIKDAINERTEELINELPKILWD
jgi:predicted DNA-binding mobile mystery protein A